MPGAVVCVMDGCGRAKLQATLSAFTAWSIITGVAVVCVTVGCGRANAQETLPASTAWSVGTAVPSPVNVRVPVWSDKGLNM